MHPVAQCLAIHAADASRLLAIHPVVNRRNRKQSPCLVGVLRLRRKAAHVVRFKIIPKANCCAHLHLPNQSGPAEMNRPTTMSQSFRRLVLVVLVALCFGQRRSRFMRVWLTLVKDLLDVVGRPYNGVDYVVPNSVHETMLDSGKGDHPLATFGKVAQTS